MLRGSSWTCFHPPHAASPRHLITCLSSQEIWDSQAGKPLIWNKEIQRWIWRPCLWEVPVLQSSNFASAFAFYVLTSSVRTPRIRSICGSRSNTSDVMSYLTSELFVPPVGVTMDCLVDFTSQPETVDPIKPVLRTGEEKYNLFCQDNIPAKKATLCFWAS